mgnify:CR=1 FL=1
MIRFELIFKSIILCCQSVASYIGLVPEVKISPMNI